MPRCGAHFYFGFGSASFGCANCASFVFDWFSQVGATACHDSTCSALCASALCIASLISPMPSAVSLSVKDIILGAVNFIAAVAFEFWQPVPHIVAFGVVAAGLREGVKVAVFAGVIAYAGYVVPVAPV